ncbi:uncharacterized protein H6S33_011031 [Morchella sextelata]|uniref:uncharacterized protein n=1 Tax=Morchella sextelata TaxID=1174677 RepID=UPI001D04226F|nr:uncharacterized protein H6S33_011031 [Morchella sextelata]KAH0611766.1 hypothetical protein H6S33_011031 [Morchella sextelata]
MKLHHFNTQRVSFLIIYNILHLSLQLSASDKTCSHANPEQREVRTDDDIKCFVTIPSCLKTALVAFKNLPLPTTSLSSSFTAAFRLLKEEIIRLLFYLSHKYHLIFQLLQSKTRI